MLRLALPLACLAALAVAPAQAQTRLPAPQPEAQPAPAPVQALAGGGNAIADTSFEASGPLGPGTNELWNGSSFQFGTVLCDLARCGTGGSANAAPRTGDWYAWFGGANPAFTEFSNLFQDFISIETPTATLNFWLRIPKVLSPTDGRLAVSLRDDSNDLNSDSLLAVFTYADQTAFDEYTRVSIPVRSTGIGQTPVFDFSNARPDLFGSNLSFFVDDVTLGPPVPYGLPVVVTDTLAVGDVQIGEPEERLLAVTNLGGETAVIEGVAYAGDPGVTVEAFTPTIEPGESGTVRIRVDPLVRGPLTGALTVTSNGPAEPEVVTVTAHTIQTTRTLFCSGVPVDLPGLPTADGAGPASPYPATVTVAGVTDPVYDVEVHLIGLSHPLAQSVDLLLEHPQGPSSWVMSDVGTNSELEDLTLILDDEADGEMPIFLSYPDRIASGRYRPTSHESVDDLPPPAPAAAFEPSFAVFDGLDPNGAWRLFGADDFGYDQEEVGRLEDWCVDIETVDPFVTATEDVLGGGEQRALAVRPNPAQGAATLLLTPATSGTLTVGLYDVVGRRVRVLHEGEALAGQPLALSVDVSALPAGLYLVRARTADGVETGRLTVIR